MTNYEKFIQTYSEFLAERFISDISYATAAQFTTPEAMAKKMTAGLLAGTASKEGYAIKDTCKVLRIKQTYKAIQEYLKG